MAPAYSLITSIAVATLAYIHKNNADRRFSKKKFRQMKPISMHRQPPKQLCLYSGAVH
jgi:hypothetical protein